MRISLYSVSKPISSKTGSIVFVFIGIIIILIGGFKQIEYNKKKEIYIPIVGSVIGYGTQTKIVEDENGHEHEEYTYCPEYEYIIGDQTYTMKSNEYSSIKPTLGTEKRMWYNPKKLNDVIVETNMYIIISIVGGVITILGIISSIIVFKKINETL